MANGYILIVFNFKKKVFTIDCTDNYISYRMDVLDNNSQIIYLYAIINMTEAKKELPTNEFHFSEYKDILSKIQLVSYKYSLFKV